MSEYAERTRRLGIYVRSVKKRSFNWKVDIGMQKADEDIYPYLGSEIYIQMSIAYASQRCSILFIFSYGQQNIH